MKQGSECSPCSTPLAHGEIISSTLMISHAFNFQKKTFLTFQEIQNLKIFNVFQISSFHDFDVEATKNDALFSFCFDSPFNKQARIHVHMHITLSARSSRCSPEAFSRRSRRFNETRFEKKQGRLDFT